MALKEKVHAALLKALSAKIKMLQNSLADLRFSSANETKSSAGDKFETSRAMLQAEQENVGRQLNIYNEQLLLVNNIDLSILHKKITSGSLIKTTEGHFFISVAAGKLSVENDIIIFLSPDAPLAKKMLGLSAGNNFEFNAKQYTITSVE